MVAQAYSGIYDCVLGGHIDHCLEDGPAMKIERVTCSSCGASVSTAGEARHLAGDSEEIGVGHYTPCGGCFAVLEVVDNTGATRVVHPDEIKAMKAGEAFLLGLGVGEMMMLARMRRS